MRKQKVENTRADFKQVRQVTKRLNKLCAKAKVSEPAQIIDLISDEITQIDKTISSIEGTQVKNWMVEIRGILSSKLEAQNE